MLNPRAFLEDCIRYGKIEFWRTGLPWDAVDSCINNDTLEYSGTEPARKFFETGSGLAWDSLNDPPNATVQCPKCSRKLSCPWTTCDDYLSVGIAGEELDSGFAAKQFEVQCEMCNMTLDHGVLRVQKFRRDLQNLLLKDIPMPGTILGINGKKMEQSLMTGIEINFRSLGVSTLIAETKKFALHNRTLLALEEKWVLFPNQIIKHGLSTNLLECTDVRKNKRASVSDIRTEFEKVLTNSSLLRMGGSKTGRLTKSEKIAVRRMMSRYWENSSTFALDLVGAVIRQGSFIEKMHSIDWIHSPAVGATMTRLIAKYGRYFEILAKFPGQVAVPTLDVDLAWYLHPVIFASSNDTNMSSGIRTSFPPELITRFLSIKQTNSLITMTRLRKISYPKHSSGHRKPTRKCSPPSIRNAPAGTAKPHANLPALSCPDLPSSTKLPNPSSTISAPPPATHPTPTRGPIYLRIMPSNLIRVPFRRLSRLLSSRATTRKQVSAPASGVENPRSETAICMRWHMATRCICRITLPISAIPASRVACTRGTRRVPILR